MDVCWSIKLKSLGFQLTHTLGTFLSVLFCWWCNRHLPDVCLLVPHRPLKTTSASWEEKLWSGAPRQTQPPVRQMSRHSRGWRPAWPGWGRRRSRSRSLWCCYPERGRASRWACRTHAHITWWDVWCSSIRWVWMSKDRSDHHPLAPFSRTLNTSAPSCFSSVFASSSKRFMILIDAFCYTCFNFLWQTIIFWDQSQLRVDAAMQKKGL